MTETMYFVPRTIESLYQELVEKGLLIQALKVNLSDYLGKVHMALGGLRNAFPCVSFQTEDRSW